MNDVGRGSRTAPGHTLYAGMMARLCERPGCSVPASVAYGFEAARTMVWLAALDPDDVDRARLGSLCRRHADSLTPPRGWWLDDRRVLVPQLFAVPDAGEPSGDPAATTGRGRGAPADPPPPGEGDASSGEPPVPRPSRRRRRHPDDPTGELPLAYTEPELFDPPAEEHPVHGVGAPAAEPPSTGDPASGGDEPVSGGDDLLDRSQQPAGASSGARPAHDPDETQALPWTPAFDHGDDLGGVLSARGPLLSRAFGLAPRPD